MAEATSVLDQTVQQLGPLMAQLSTGQALEAALLQATLRWARQARQRLNRSAGVGRQGRMLHQTKPCRRACCNDAPEERLDTLLALGAGHRWWLFNFPCKATTGVPGRAMPWLWGQNSEGYRQAGWS